MKNNLQFTMFFLAGLLLTTACSVPMANVVKPDQMSSPDKVIIIGKLSFNPPLKQKLNRVNNKNWTNISYIFLSTDPEKPCDHGMNADLTMKVNWDEYFVLEVPRKQFYLRKTMLMLSVEGSSTTYLDFKCAFPLPLVSDTGMIYIGDLIYQLNKKNELGGVDTVLEVRDNSAKLPQEFTHFVKKNDGTYLTPKTILLKGGKVEAGMQTITAVVQ